MPHTCLLFVTALAAADVDGTEGCETGMPGSPAVHIHYTTTTISL